MKVAIVGSRNIHSMHKVISAVFKSGFAVSEIVSGGAKGVDACAEKLSIQWEIPIHIFRPHTKHGASFADAALARNAQIAEFADACIAIPCPRSTGTWDTVSKFRMWGKPVFVYDYFIDLETEKDR